MGNVTGKIVTSKDYNYGFESDRAKAFLSAYISEGVGDKKAIEMLVSKHFNITEKATVEFITAVLLTNETLMNVTIRQSANAMDRLQSLLEDINTSPTVN